MGFKEVLADLNSLRETGIIKDYAIGGGYAVTFYDVPIMTYDLDVFVVLGSEDAYHNLFEHYRHRGNKIEEVYIYIDDIPVQFLPSDISPLSDVAVKEAHEIDFEGVKGRIIKKEHLIALLLTAFRPKDIIRIRSLIDKVNKASLEALLRKFDNEKDQLYKRYKKVLAGA